jgi:hypothetical protein
LREADAVLRQRIDIGRLNFSPETTDVGVTNVIGHDDDDVWLVGRIGKVAKANEDQKPGGLDAR